MKYREISIENDYVLNTFLQNNAECVGQAVLTRLRQFLGEWFLDTNDGTPWYENILGHSQLYDLEIQDRILGTKGVKSIIYYQSQLTTTRKLSVQVELETIYGNISINI